MCLSTNCNRRTSHLSYYTAFNTFICTYRLYARSWTQTSLALQSMHSKIVTVLTRVIESMDKLVSHHKSNCTELEISNVRGSKILLSFYRYDSSIPTHSGQEGLKKGKFRIPSRISAQKFCD